MLTVPRLAATKRSTAPSDNLVDDAELNRATAPLAPLVDLPLVAPLHAEPRAPEEVPDDESAASALLAFLSAARTAHGGAPVIAPAGAAGSADRTGQRRQAPPLAKSKVKKWTSSPRTVTRVASVLFLLLLLFLSSVCEVSV